VRRVILAVVGVVGISACSFGGATTTTTTTTPVTTPTTTVPVITTTVAPTGTTAPSLDAPPSQSPEDAARDGVVPELAELPFELRVEIDAEIDLPDSRWALSRPSVATYDLTDGCRLGDPDGLYGRDSICVLEYGEVLLLDGTGTTILRAYPLPRHPPQAIVISDDDVYCIRQGDGALPDSMLCRIDRITGEWTVRVFPLESESAFVPLPADRFIPGNWVINEPDGWIGFEGLFVRDDGLLQTDGYSGTAIFDPVTLEMLD